MGLKVAGAQRYFTPQAGLCSQRWLPIFCCGRAAVTQHITVILLALWTGKVTFPFGVASPSFPNAGWTEAVSAGQGVGLAEAVPTHRAGQLLVQRCHCAQLMVPNDCYLLTEFVIETEKKMLIRFQNKQTKNILTLFFLFLSE